MDHLTKSYLYFTRKSNVFIYRVKFLRYKFISKGLYFTAPNFFLIQISYMIYQNNTRTEFFDIHRTELPDSLQEPRGSRPIFFIRWLPRSNHSYPKHYQNNSFCTLYSKNIVFSNLYDYRSKIVYFFSRRTGCILSFVRLRFSSPISSSRFTNSTSG